MASHDFYRHKSYLEGGLDLPVVVFYDHNYLRTNSQNDIRKFKEKVKRMTQAASKTLYQNFKISLKPYFYPSAYEHHQNRTVYDWDTGTFSCTDYYMDTQKILDRFYNVSRPILRHEAYKRYKVVQPIGMLFASCTNPEKKGWAYTNGAFYGMASKESEEIPRVASVTILSNPDVEEYEEAYSILHEFGHVFGSEHDDISICGNSFPRFIMCPYAQDIPESRKKYDEIDLTWLKFSSKSIEVISSGLRTAKSLIYAKSMLSEAQDNSIRWPDSFDDTRWSLSAEELTAMSLISTDLSLNNIANNDTLVSTSASFSHDAYVPSRYFEKHTPDVAWHIHLSIFTLLIQSLIILAMLLKSKIRLNTKHD